MMKMQMRWNKKAQSVEADPEAGELGSESIHYIIYFGIVFMVAFLLFLSARAYAEADLKVEKFAEVEIYAERVFNCFAFRDHDTGRTTAFIDESLMSEERLAQCFKDSKRSVYVELNNLNHETVKAVYHMNRGVPTTMSRYPVVYIRSDKTLHKGSMVVGVTLL